MLPMPKGTTKSMAGTKNHDLSDLTGKKIKSITLQEVDIHDNGEDVRQFYQITCADGDKFVLSLDGHNTQQYVTAELMDADDFADFLEQLECESADDVLDTDDADEVNSEDDADLFDGAEDFDEDEDDDDE